MQKWSGFHFCLVFLTLEEDEEVMLQHSLHCTIFFPRKKKTQNIYFKRFDAVYSFSVAREYCPKDEQTFCDFPPDESIFPGNLPRESQ